MRDRGPLIVITREELGESPDSIRITPKDILRESWALRVRTAWRKARRSVGSFLCGAAVGGLGGLVMGGVETALGGARVLALPLAVGVGFCTAAVVRVASKSNSSAYIYPIGIICSLGGILIEALLSSANWSYLQSHWGFHVVQAVLAIWGVHIGKTSRLGGFAPQPSARGGSILVITRESLSREVTPVSEPVSTPVRRRGRLRPEALAPITTTEQRCAICHHQVTSGPGQVCSEPGCGKVHLLRAHDGCETVHCTECWEYIGGCSMTGCRDAPEAH